jgi:16S rRNA (uracil1498-N3)-methyltransferase
VNAFFVEEVRRGLQDLGPEAAHHARVKRLEADDRIQLIDGQGNVAIGHIVEVTKSAVQVQADDVAFHDPPPAIRLCVPVGDKDRMLWVAEKAVELQVAEWIPVMFERSKSVNPRGEGESFDRKVLARMISALEQSGGAWLPQIHPTRTVDDLANETGILLERGGKPIAGLRLDAPVTIAVGPEGGFTPAELSALRDRGWTAASLGDITLRFETAAIGALAVARALST